MSVEVKETACVHLLIDIFELLKSHLCGQKIYLLNPIKDKKDVFA